MSELKVDGFDDIYKMLDDMQITDGKKKKALSLGCDIVLKRTKENAPVLTGRTKRSIKKYVRQGENGDTTCTIKVNDFTGMFTEYGTSKDKSHVGWFSNAVKDTEDKAIEKIKEVLLR
ncbi:MAG: hypothetical protein DBY38_02085 [Clostridium cadaveris]|uniref:Phage protein, HK97 gp10 family n=1 Tax=Clostridium cadaveris TaxID=1529 RepID=A0A316ME40_9CLOT|nr:HK97-gp10 family putative phage morphogenesis protein [Clostridium cadaveris]MDU4953636.1 hypothetical protein [Clostridium sp.]NWK11322.1 hypothetical protein [Clostridium cadaveris]PWL55385.1 MAG: hypothetical protein DBY38_02085 [Clostridium cadaveris]